MLAQKCSVLQAMAANTCAGLFVILLIGTGESIIQDEETARTIWNLTKFAIRNIQSRQSLNQQGYGLLQYPIPNRRYPPNPVQGQYPNVPNCYNCQSFTKALDSIARYDELRCVPKLLCEIASGSGTKTGQSPSSSVPSFINIDSLLETLSAISDSPLLLFGRAALLGYTSKDSTSSCSQAYPKCPRDPDRLVEYLNNHNGGFFRFFNGKPLPIHNQNFDTYQAPFHYGQYAQKRIQTKPHSHAQNFNYGWKFPLEYTRKEKQLDGNVPMVFPDRTGTGDLRLDPENNDVFFGNNVQTHSNNDVFYFDNNGLRASEEAHNGQKFKFPVYD